jgi:hypothetical protein
MSVRVCCLDWSVVPGGWDGLGMTRWEQNGEMERDSERESAGAGGQAFRRKQMPPYRLLTSSADLVGPRLLLATRYSPLDMCPSLHIDQETQNRDML